MDVLEILSFNEKSTFDTSALFGKIERNLSHMKQKYQKWIIHQKQRVPTFEGFSFLNLGHSFSYKFKNSCMYNTVLVWDFLISFLGPS